MQRLHIDGRRGRRGAARSKNSGSAPLQLRLPRRNLIGVDVELLGKLSYRPSPLTAASATFALKAGVWFRRARLLIVAPDSQAPACPLSGRNSTYRPVQIFGAGSVTASDMQRDGTLRCFEGSAVRPVASPSHTGSNGQRVLPIA